MIRARVLADSSIWINHIAGKPGPLAELLKRRQIALHPMVIGEIALGSLKDRKPLLEEMKQLPQLRAATNSEVIAMVEWLQLFNTGIGFVDAHLIATTQLNEKVSLLTTDKRLQAQAERLGVAYAP